MAPPDRQPTAAEARAEVEARRVTERAEREAAFRELYGNHVPGRWIVVVSWLSTVILAVVTALAAVDPDDAIGAFFVVAVAWFFVGSALFALVVVLAAGRSRESSMGIGGLFFLAGSAPRAVQWNLLGSLLAQVAVSIAGAAVRPFTPLAFGTLAPMLPLALCGLWGVLHGRFPPREA
ncbi:MAG: hypothetical protein ACOYOP_06135 [Microthrixaceae bacterium]